MIAWTTEKEKKLQELVTAPENYSESQIAGAMTTEFEENFTRDSVHNKILRLDFRSLVKKPKTITAPYYDKYKDIIEGIAPDKTVKLSDTIKSTKLKILHLGDLHVPFAIDAQVDTAINRNLTADIVVTCEVMDCYSLSRFGKFENVPLEIEIDNTIRYLEHLSETFKTIFVMTGNHEQRVAKTVFKNIPASLFFLIEENMLKALAKPFQNVVVIEQPYLQINDAVFIHAEMFSKTDMKAGVNAYSFLQEWKESLGLKPFSICLEQHTHMLGTTYRGGKIKIMETGCLCGVPRYAVDGFYSKPQTNGYVVINQNNGITDFNTTREYVFPTPYYNSVEKTNV